MSEQEVRTLWQVLDRERFPWNCAIKLILLTGARRGEVFDAEWREFDLDRKLWTIPWARSKNGREHRLPLSDLAIDIVRAVPRGVDTKLFPARGNPGRGASGFSKAMGRILQKMEVASRHSANFTLQDLRRTVATNLQRLGVKLEVTEAVLNHVSGSRDGVVGIYQRYQFEDEKRLALEQWAAELARIIDRDLCCRVQGKEDPCL